VPLEKTDPAHNAFRAANTTSTVMAPLQTRVPHSGQNAPKIIYKSNKTRVGGQGAAARAEPGWGL